MQDRLVAADASPLIGMAAAGAFDLLRALFGTVTVTRVVLEEIAAGGTRPGAREVSAATRSGWITVAPAPIEMWDLAELGPGEASTIALALRRSGPSLVLMDDAAGRARAEALGLTVRGLPDVLLAAKRARLVDALGPLLRRLAARDFVLAEEAVRAALEAAGEMTRPTPLL